MWLMLMTPDADALVGSWRADHDPSARCGIGAHVTVRTPFLPPERWEDPALRETLDPLVPADVRLARLEDRPGGLVILVEPDDALRKITNAVSAAYPSLPPHKGDRPTFAYHVTVVRTEDPVIRTEARNSIEPYLPLNVGGTEFRASTDLTEAGIRHVPILRAPNTTGH